MHKRVAGVLLSFLLMAALCPLWAFADEDLGLTDNEGDTASESMTIDAHDSEGVDAGEAEASGEVNDAAAGTEESTPAAKLSAAQGSEDLAPATKLSAAQSSEDLAPATKLSAAQGSEDLTSATKLSAAGATKVSPNGGKGSGTLNSSTKTKEFTVTLDYAGRLTINVSTGLDLNFGFFDGTSSSYDNYAYEKINKGSESFTYDLKPGTYTLEFSRYSYNDSGSFSFTTSFVSANETYTNDNNTINAVRAGSAIPFSSWINGQIAWNDKIDYYKMEMNSSGRLVLSVHNDTEKIEIYLYDADENYISVDSSMAKGDNSYTYDLAAGVYYLTFERYSSDRTGLYKFKAAFTPSGETYKGDNNTVNAVRNTASIPLAKTIKGQLAYNDKYDYYKVSIPAKTRYSLNVKSDIPKVEFALYDANENSIRDTSGYGYFTHDKGSKTYTYELNSGTYYLVFERYSTGYTGTYNFRINVSVPKPGIKSVSKGKKSFTVKWGKKSGVTGYQIQYGRKSSFKGAKIKTVNSASKTSKKIKKLKARKKYYVRVRAYKVLNGATYYSSWSKSKSVKTR